MNKIRLRLESVRYVPMRTVKEVQSSFIFEFKYLNLRNLLNLLWTSTSA